MDVTKTLTFPALGCEALGLGSNDGDEECYKIISAPALWHKLGLTLPPNRSLLFCAARVPYLRRKHLSHPQAKPKHIEIHGGQRRSTSRRQGFLAGLTTAWGPATAQRVSYPGPVTFLFVKWAKGMLGCCVDSIGHTLKAISEHSYKW